MGFIIKNGVLKKYTKEDGIRDIVIPKGIKVIEHGAFMNFESLKSVNMPDSVETIGQMAFAYCPNLKSVRLSANLKEIGTYAFGFCYSLKNITIPKSVEKIGESAFTSTEWRTIKLNENPILIVNNILVAVDSEEEKVVIPYGTKIISNKAFFKSHIKELTIPDNMADIEHNAFFDCDSLNSITIQGKKASITIYYRFFNIYNETRAYTRKLFDFICCKLEEKTELLKQFKNKTYRNLLSVYMFFEYGDIEIESYIKRSITNIVKTLTDNNDVENLTKLLPLGYVTEKNIDDMLQHAIETKKPEIQVILGNYKNDNFGFKDNLDEFLLE